MIDDRRWTLPLGIMIDCPGTLMQRILRRRQTMLDVRRPTYDGRFTDGLTPNASTHRPTPASSTIRRQGRICGWRPPPCRRWCRRCGTSSLSRSGRFSLRGTPLDVCSTRACPQAAWPTSDGDSPQGRGHRRPLVGVSSPHSIHARRWSLVDGQSSAVPPSACCPSCPYLLFATNAAAICARMAAKLSTGDGSAFDDGHSMDDCGCDRGAGATSVRAPGFASSNAGISGA